MKLTFDQIKAISTGIVDAQEEDGMLCLKRFTLAQEELYKATKHDSFVKSFSTAGIKFLFKTNSKTMTIKFKTELATSRKFFSLEVLVNGAFVDCIDNFSDVELPQDYIKYDFTLGEFSKSFSLGEGEKTVCVYLPWSVKTLIQEVALDDGAFAEPIKPQKKLIAFGDSITQGYDAFRSFNSYTTKLADKLGVELYNKGIGAERFLPELGALSDPFVPDYVTVAYGTNDWYKIDEATFNEKCKGFYSNLSANYPDSMIFAISPIWRKDMHTPKKFGPFEKVEEDIRKAVEQLSNVIVISGFDFIPKEEKYFSDLNLHPNDDGFAYYADSLYEAIKASL